MSARPGIDLGQGVDRSLGEIGNGQRQGFGDNEAQSDLATRSNLSLLEIDAVIGFVDDGDLGESLGGEWPAGGGALAEGEPIRVVAGSPQLRLELELKGVPCEAGAVLDHLDQRESDGMLRVDLVAVSGIDPKLQNPAGRVRHALDE